MNKTCTIAVAGAALIVFGPTAHAIEAKASGHINRAIMMADDGTFSETHHVDNAMSGTRFRFTGSADLMPGTRAGVTFETDFLSNPSNDVTQTMRSVDPELGERVMEVYFQGGFGEISLGQGPGAADGGIEVDLSGTNVVTGTLGHNLGSAMAFRNGSGAAIGSATIGKTLSNQDFESRYDRLRYDTPALGPITISGSTGQKSERNVKEVALRVNTALGGGGKLAGAIGFSREDTADINFDNETTGGSVSWLAPMGLNVTLAYSKSEISTTREGVYKYVKVGYKTGAHAVSTDYTLADDENAAGDEAKRIGIGYVFAPQKWADVYAGYYINSLDRPGVTAEDIEVLTIGSRLKF